MPSSQRDVHGTLRLDRVLASQPELGPSIPDGGYGWIVLIATLILQALLPSILVSYGIFMLFMRLEGPDFNSNPRLSEAKLIPAPIVFVAFWTLSEPWSRTIVTTGKWPKLTSACGVLIVCSGILFQWIAFTNGEGMLYYMISGALSGFGASLATTQSEILINQYFRVKLPIVKNLLACAYAIGFIITPITLGLIILKNGILHGFLIYQCIILQLVLVVMVYRKPLYLKAQRRPYELIQNISEDDEMIYAKDLTELSTAPSGNVNDQPSSSNNTNAIQNFKPLETPKANLLLETFAEEFRQDLGERQSEENDPKPIFIEVDVKPIENTYSFDNNVAVEDNSDAFRPPERIEATTFKQEISFLWKLSFYKSWLLLSMTRYSILIFWILFPTYLYVEMDTLKVQQTSFLVGCIGLGSLFVGMFSSFLPTYGSTKQSAMAVFCFTGSLGYFVISDAGTEGWLLFGALLVTLSVTVFHILHNSVTRFILGIDTEKAHTLLHTLVGITILMFLINGNTSYRNCFRLMSLLQFLTGSMLLTAFFYKKIKHLFTNLG